MAKKQQKINFFNVHKKLYDTGRTEVPASNLKEIIDYILSLSKIDRRYKLHNSKFTLLDSGDYDTRARTYKLTFKTAKHSFRPNLIDRDTTDERPNPKRMNEGDINKTHLIIKFKTDEVLLILEKTHSGVNYLNVKNYLTEFARKLHDRERTEKNYSIEFDVLVKNNFLAEMGNLKRVTLGEIFIDKKILGSRALNYSDRITTVQQDLQLTIKPKIKENIVEAVTDMYNKLNSGRSEIRKIRVRGQNADNNNVLIDTSFIEKVEFVNVDRNLSTGELESDQILVELSNIANRL